MEFIESAVKSVFFDSMDICEGYWNMSDNKLFSEQVAKNIKRQGSDRQLVVLCRKWLRRICLT